MFSPVAGACLLLGALAANATSYHNIILADNPVAYYRLEEASGSATAVDSSASGAYPGTYNYNLDINSVPDYPKLGQNGIDTNSLFFHYYVDASNIPHSGTVTVNYDPALNGTGAFTAECWVRPTITTSGQDYRSPIGNFGGYNAANNYSGSGWKFYQQPGANNWAFVMDPGVAFITAGSITPFQWYHLVGVYNGSNAAFFYINGVQVGSSAISGYLPNTANPLMIGARDPGYGYFDGNVDEVAIYTNALSAAQILAHYQAGTNSFSSRPVAPLIVQDPSPATSYAGHAVSFSVVADGTTPLHYQWLRGTTPIAGATAATLTFNCTVADNGANYSAVVTNAFGTIHSAAVALTVSTGLLIDHDAFSITRHAGSNSMAAFRVAAEGALPLSYQWFRITNSITNSIVGATNDTLWLSGLKAADDQSMYFARVANSFTSTNGAPATLTVDARPVTVPITKYAQVVVADKPTAYWRFDETTGSTVATDAVGSFDGTYTQLFGPDSIFNYQIATGIPHETDSGLHVTNSAYVTVPYALELNPVSGPWSAEVWLMPTSNDGGNFRTPIASLWNSDFGGHIYGWNVYQHPASAWTFNAFSGGGGGSFNSDFSDIPLNLNTWYHMVITDDLTTLRMYINTRLVVTLSRAGFGFIPNGINGDPAVAGGRTVFGQRSDNAFAGFDGGIDDAAFYNYALSAQQIQNHFLNTTKLLISKSGGNVVLTWGTGTLQSATTVTGPYTNVIGATSPYTTAISGAQKYYRVQLQ